MLGDDHFYMLCVAPAVLYIRILQRFNTDWTVRLSPSGIFRLPLSSGPNKTLFPFTLHRRRKLVICDLNVLSVQRPPKSGGSSWGGGWALLQKIRFCLFVGFDHFLFFSLSFLPKQHLKDKIHGQRGRDWEFQGDWHAAGTDRHRLELNSIAISCSCRSNAEEFGGHFQE